MDAQKFNEVMSDEAFVKSLSGITKAEDLQKALNDKGVDVTIDELKELKEAAKKHSSGELSDDDLESVAGGGFLRTIAEGLFDTGIKVFKEVVF